MRMRKRASVVCLLPLFLIAASGESGTQSSRTTAIVGATVIDGTGGPPLPDATIVVTDKRIAAVGPRSSVDVPEGALVVDASGQFITPGLIDTNVHLSVTFARSGPSKETAVKYWERNAELTLEAAQMQLKYGVTTVRDSYGALLPLKEVRDAIAHGEVIGPRMLVAGNIVGWGGPFSVSFSLVREEGLSLWEEQINDAVTQGSGEELMEMYPEELREAISAYLDKGPDFIKFGGTSHWSPTFIGFSEKAQRILVEETHKRGRIAETHSTSPEGLRISIEAGVDLIQHPEVLAGREISDELVRQIREREIVCSMLVNRWGGQGYQEHLEARKAAEARLASEESAAQKPGLKRAGEEGEDLRGAAARTGAPGSRHRDEPGERKETHRGRLHRDGGDGQRSRGRAGVLENADRLAVRLPGAGLRDHLRHRESGGARHERRRSHRGWKPKRRHRLEGPRGFRHPRGRQICGLAHPGCRPHRGYLESQKVALGHEGGPEDRSEDPAHQPDSL